MIIRTGIFIASLIVGCWFATMMVVAKLGQSVSAQEGIIIINRVIYPPWLWVKWFFLYGKHGQSIFIKTMWPIYASVVLGIALAWAYRLIFAKRFSSIAHGSARWANEDELKAAGLTDNTGIVLGRTTKTQDLLCHDGPEHVLLIGYLCPSPRKGKSSLRPFTSFDLAPKCLVGALGS